MPLLLVTSSSRISLAISASIAVASQFVIFGVAVQSSPINAFHDGALFDESGFNPGDHRREISPLGFGIFVIHVMRHIAFNIIITDPFDRCFQKFLTDR